MCITMNLKVHISKTQFSLNIFKRYPVLNFYALLVRISVFTVVRLGVKKCNM